MGYTDPIPANYDESSIAVDPGGLNSCASSITSMVQFISYCLSDINKTLGNLTLSWTGDAANAATNYNNEWNAAVEALFGKQTSGTPSGPIGPVTVTPSSAAADNAGALNTLVNGLSSAAQNYSTTENTIASMFNKYTGALTSPAPAPSAPQSVPDQPSSPVDGQFMYHTTSVDEQYPSGGNS
jgi:uncharacterized protein YukE